MMKHYFRAMCLMTAVWLFFDCAGPARYRFSCIDGTLLKAVFRKNGERVRLHINDRRYILRRVPGGTTPRYRNGSIEFWTENDQAFVKIDGAFAYRACVEIEK